jgi:hypothetical protein
VHRVRITVRHNPEDPADDLRIAARVRRDLWAHSPAEVDPGSPIHGTHRDSERNAYFEFATNHLDEVKRVLREYGYGDRVAQAVVEEADGAECLSCGNISPELVTVCPTCGFRDVSPCPYCNSEIPRLEYLSIAGELFKCPKCAHRVRLQVADPLFDAQGHYNQPLVRVVPAEAPVNHEV